MSTQINLEQLLDKNVDINTFINIIMSLNASSNRRIKYPLAFSIYTNTADSISIDFCSNQHNMKLIAPLNKIEKNHSPIMHNHEYYELMYILKGSIKIRIENIIYTYSAGDICLFNQNIHHAEIQQQNSCILYCCITRIFLDRWPESDTLFYPKEHKAFSRFFANNSESRCSNNFLEFRLQDSYRNSAEKKPAALCLLLKIKRELVNQNIGAWLIIYGLFARFLSLLSSPEYYKCKYITAQSNDIVDIVSRYIESHPQRLSREDIASDLHYSADYLNRIFHKSTGMTLSSYCGYTYMKRAANLLLQTDNTIEEISETIGFSNPSQFYRLFKKYYHMSPHEYRKTCRQLLIQNKQLALHTHRKL